MITESKVVIINSSGKMIPLGRINIGVLHSKILSDYLKETHDTSELSGASGGSVLWSQQILDTFVQVRQVREEYARIADNYFSMFGYKVCRLKVPNISTRPSWNFVKCSTVTITGAIPSDAEELIMGVLKKGVTFWKTSFGNYTANNK